MRLQKMIAQTSELSRRAAEKAISEGKVTVNGRVVKVLGSKVDPLADRVCLAGRPLKLPRQFHYLVFYKPCGFLVTKKDTHGRPTIWDKLEEWKEILNAVGRLDFNSEGLLLLTNDGEMINGLTHPRHRILKLYEVGVRGEPKTAQLDKLRKGIRLDDQVTLPAQVKILNTGPEFTLLKIGIKEGRKRQIRRMCEAIGHPVSRLKRIAVGPVTLKGLKPGQWRHLSQKEIAALNRVIQNSKCKSQNDN